MMQKLLGAILSTCILSSCNSSTEAEEPAIQSVFQEAGQFQRGLIYELDGEDYFLDGPLLDAKRDIPGHVWQKGGGNSPVFTGRHYNTGPLGMAQWWSSDAADAALLFHINARIDEWSPAKAASYLAQGFSHYHEFVRVSDRSPHPTKVAWLKHVAVATFQLDGGPKPWLAHAVQPGVDSEFMPNLNYAYPPKEKLLYVGCVDKGGADPDFIAVIGTDPNEPSTFSQVIHRVDLPGIGDEIHHYGKNIFNDRLLVPGLFSGRLHVIDIGTDPAHPSLLSFHDNLLGDSGYAVPHTVIGMPDGGYVLTTIGNTSTSTGPGGMVKLDANGEFVAPFGPPSQRDSTVVPPTYMYDVGMNPLRNVMISTSFGLPADVAGGITIGGLGTDIYVWDMASQQVTQVENIGAGTGPLEVRWLHEPGSTIGYTNAPGTSEIWMWDDEDGDGTYAFSVAIALPAGSIPTDILLSKDDKYLYVSNWVGSNVMQYDVTNPFQPIFVSMVTIPSSQMMRLSPDNRRLYVTNSLLSTWDDSEFPTGTFRNAGYGVFLIDIDHTNGGMTLSSDFYVDLDSIQKKNTVGPARPHQIFFDPGIAHEFGSH